MVRKPFILFCVMLVLVCTACGSAENQCEFPLKSEDIERELSDRKLPWKISHAEYKDSQAIFTLTNDDGVTLGFGSNIYETGKILSVTWSLPFEFTTDQFNRFYSNELSHLFDLASSLYGNSKQLKKALKEFSEYYDKVKENSEGGIYWTKRTGDDHMLIDIKPVLGSKDNRNRLGTLLITYSKSYEQYLQSLYESWKKAAQINSIKIEHSTLDAINKAEQDVNEKNFSEKHFVIRGRLDNVKEINNIPEALKNAESNFLKSNKDKYLSAKLTDDTGSIDVFLQTTSLNADELKMERDHNVMMYYYKHNPFFVVRFSPLSE